MGIPPLPRPIPDDPKYRFEVLLPSGDVVEVSRDVYERQDESLRRVLLREEK